jgi:hypothetical protein
MSAQSRSTFADSGEWLVNTIKRNPEGLLLLAAGAVLLLRTNARSSGVGQSSARDRPSSRPSPAAEGANAVRETFNAASEAVSDAARRTLDTASSYASTAADYADKARRTVSQQSERITQQTQSVFRTILQDQPLAVVVGGIAAGVAVAATFPPTQLERDTLGPLGEEMSKAAGELGEQVKQATTKAGEKLKTSADQRGLNTETLRDLADEAVDAFKASMQGQPREYETGTEKTEVSAPAPLHKGNRP